MANKRQKFSTVIELQGKADFSEISKQLEKLREEAKGKGSDQDLLGLDNELKNIKKFSEQLHKAMEKGFETPQEFEKFDKTVKEFFRSANSFTNQFKGLSIAHLHDELEKADKDLKAARESYKEIASVNAAIIRAEAKKAQGMGDYANKVVAAAKAGQSIKDINESTAAAIKEQVDGYKQEADKAKQALETAKANLEVEKQRQEILQNNYALARGNAERLNPADFFKGKGGKELSNTALSNLRTAFNVSMGLTGNQRTLYNKFKDNTDREGQSFKAIENYLRERIDKVAGVDKLSDSEFKNLADKIYNTLLDIANAEKAQAAGQNDVSGAAGKLNKAETAAKSAQATYEAGITHQATVEQVLNNTEIASSVDKIVEAYNRRAKAEERYNVQKEITEEEALSDAYREVAESINEASTATEKIVGDTAEVVQSQSLIDAGFDRLKGRITTLFSLGTAYNQVRKTIQQTFNDVKSIDKAFTEIAMVTNYSVQQMWGTYDQYAQIANELGQTTESVIRASSLYYQQGLQTNEAIQLATDTMKLATLAGLDFEQATSLMTSAIRGFHMEMDQGAHVTDVYSQLAAKAAATVNDIAQAMSRTASIANSAGMSFENTAAMLTTMIEATQESAENLGTAMKTINSNIYVSHKYSAMVVYKSL